MTDKVLDAASLDVLFREARTHGAWLDKVLPDGLVEQIYDLVRMGPTSVNSCPARFVFLETEEARLRIKPHLDAGNVDKVMGAPCCVIVAYDREFYRDMPKLLPPPMAERAAEFFAANPDQAEVNAMRSSTLQGAYLIMAARALGLDCGPMQGFDRDGVDQEFFPGSSCTANFLVNLGYGDDTKLRARMPRLSFEDACTRL